MRLAHEPADVLAAAPEGRAVARVLRRVSVVADTGTAPMAMAMAMQRWWWSA
jgi:hypothetical protein